MDNNFDLIKLAIDTNTPQDILIYLSEQAPLNIKKILVKNVCLPDEALFLLLFLNIEYLNEYIAIHPNLSKETCELLFKLGGDGTRHLISLRKF